jgi:excisionase family DNA binding protein
MAKMFFSTSEVADLFNVNRVTIYRWVKEGMVKGYKVGKHLKIPLAEVERLKREFGFGDLPLDKLQGGEAGAAEAGKTAPGTPYKKLVMAIDDDENILTFIQNAFEGLGLNRHCNLKTYANGSRRCCRSARRSRTSSCSHRHAQSERSGACREDPQDAPRHQIIIMTGYPEYLTGTSAASSSTT